MTSHLIKIRKAARLTDLSRYPLTWAAIMSKIPDMVMATCTAREIAAIADAMREQHQQGYWQGYEEAK